MVQRVTAITPSAGPPGAETVLSGPDLWSLKFVVDEADLTQRVGPVLFGTFQGQFDAEGGERTFWRADWRWHFRATTPAPAGVSANGTGFSEDGSSLQSALAGLLGVAGGVDVDLRFQGSQHNGAKAVMSSELDHMAMDGSR